MIHSLHIEGYRSLLDFSIKLAPLTIVQGENGVGKSNLYKSLHLFSSLAQGAFPEAMAREGGTPSCLWAGPISGPPRPKRINLKLAAADFEWKVSFGLVPTGPADPTAFRTDPEVKKETLSSPLGTHSRAQWSPEIPHNESMLSFIRDAVNFPALSTAREQILSWRFFDSFRHDIASPLRAPSPRVWSPTLHHDGSNLAAVLQTIRESSMPERLDEVIQIAFPEHQLEIDVNDSQLSLLWHQPALSRALTALELSDGTLRFLTLCAAFLNPKAPSLLVVNEPENSLNDSLFPALAKLICYAAEASQLLIITHSQKLADLISEETDAALRQLALQDGATRLKENLGPRRVWNFD